MRNEIIQAFRSFVDSKGVNKPIKLIKFVSLIFRQFALPMERTNAVRYDKPVAFTGQDLLNFWTDK